MKFRKIFQGDGSPFGAKYEAEAWLEERGYSVGSSCVMGPQAVIARPDVLVAKWKNLTAAEKVAVDGRLEAGRNCPAVLDLREPPAGEDATEWQSGGES